MSASSDDETCEARVVAWFRERAARHAAWRAESEATGVPFEELRAAYFATPEGKYEARIHEVVAAAPPPTEEQLATLRRIFRTTRGVA